MFDVNRYSCWTNDQRRFSAQWLFGQGFLSLLFQTEQNLREPFSNKLEKQSLNQDQTRCWCLNWGPRLVHKKKAFSEALKTIYWRAVLQRSQQPIFLEPSEYYFHVSFKSVQFLKMKNNLCLLDLQPPGTQKAFYLQTECFKGADQKKWRQIILNEKGVSEEK